MAWLNVAMTAIKVISKMSAKKAVSSGAKKFITNKAKEKVKGKIKDKFLGKKDKKEKGGALAVRPSSAIMVSGSTPLLPSTSTSNSFNSKSDKSSSIIKKPTEKVNFEKPTEKVNFEKLTESINNIVRITEDLNDASKKQLENDKDILEDERKRRQEAARKRRESLLESGKKVAGSAVKGAAAVGGKFDLMKFFENILLGGAFLAIINLLSGNQKTLDNLSQNIFRIYKVLPRLLKFLFDPLGLFEGAFKLIKKLLSPLTDTIKNAVSNLTNKVKEVFERGFKNLGTAITEFVDDLGKKLKNAFTEALEQAAKQAEEILQAAQKQAEAIVKAAKEQAERLVREATENLIKPAVEAVQQNVLDPVVETAKKGAKSAFNRLPEGLQKGLTNVGQGAENIVKSGVGLARSGFNALADVSKNIGKALYELPGNAIKGAREVGENLAKQAANLKDTGEKALKEFAEKNLKPVMTKLLDENPLIKSAKKFFTNPKTIKATVKTVDDQAKGVIGILKNARKSGLTQLGPLDRVIAVIESVVRYGLGEAPVNAVLQTLGGVLGYAAGFAIGGPFGGVPGLITGLVGSELGERAAKLLIKSLLPLGKNEDGSPKPDPIAQTLGLPERPLIRDPYMEFEDYRNQFDIEGGKFFNADIPNLLGGASENTTPTTQSSGSESKTNDTSPQVQPQERMMGGGVGKYSPLFDLIAASEGNYNSINRGRAGDSPGGAAKYLGKNLTDMTVGEIIELQTQKKLYAAGKYQIVPGTMLDFVARGGVKRSDMFNSKTQEKFPEYVVNIKRPIVGKYFEGKASLDDAVINLAAEFASIGVPRYMKRGEFGSGYPKSDRPKGSTFYGGTSNKAHTTPESVAAALQSIKGGATQEDQQSSEVEKVMKEQNITKEEAERYISSDMESGPGPVDASYSGGSTSAQVDDSEKGETKLPEVNPQGGGGSGGESMSSKPEQAELEPPPTGGGGGGGASSSAQSVSKRASYEQGADQDLVIPLPQQQNGGEAMIRSKSRVMMMGSDSLNRYYKAQLLGALYKRG